VQKNVNADFGVVQSLRFAWQLWRTNALRMLQLCAITPVLSLLLVPLLLPLIPEATTGALFLGGIVAAVLGQILVFPLFFGAVAASLLPREPDEQKLRFSESLGAGVGSWLRVALVQWLLGLASMLPFLIASYVLLQYLQEPVLALAAYYWLSPVLAIPGMVIFIIYGLGLVAVVAEECGVLPALARSAELTRRRRLRILGIFVLAAVILWAIEWVTSRVAAGASLGLSLDLLQLFETLRAPQSVVEALAIFGYAQWFASYLIASAAAAVLVATYVRAGGMHSKEKPAPAPLPVNPPRVLVTRAAEGPVGGREAPAPFEWTPDLLAALDQRSLREFCEGLWQVRNYRVQMRPFGGAEKYDLALYGPSDPERLVAVVLCKANPIGKIGLPAVQQLAAVAQSAGASVGIFMTTSEFQESALEFARDKRLKLLDGRSLLAEVGAAPPERRLQLIESTLMARAAGPSCSHCGVKVIKRRRLADDSTYWLCRQPAQCAQLPPSLRTKPAALANS